MRCVVVKCVCRFAYGIINKNCGGFFVIVVVAPLVIIRQNVCHNSDISNMISLYETIFR